MNSQPTIIKRFVLSLERLGNTKSFSSVTGLIQFILDIVAWSAAATMALLMRSSLQDVPNIGSLAQDTLFRALPAVVIIQAVTGYVVGIYRHRWRYGSFDEVKGLIVSATVTTTTPTQMEKFPPLFFFPFPPKVVSVSTN